MFREQHLPSVPWGQGVRNEASLGLVMSALCPQNLGHASVFSPHRNAMLCIPEAGWMGQGEAGASKAGLRFY